MEERRSSGRLTGVPVTIHQCIVTQLGKETWLNASAVDLSAQGLSLMLSDSLDSGESIYILATVSPPGKAPRDLEVNGISSYCRPTDGNRWRVGVKFIDLTDEEQVQWSEFLGSNSLGG